MGVPIKIKIKTKTEKKKYIYIYISDKWDIPQFYHEKGLHSYLSTFSLAAVKLPDTDI